MEHKKKSFEQALADAQELGLAEADPSLDIGGFDSGHKIAIMSSLSFNCDIDIKKVPITGIKEVENIDISFAKQLGYTMKLIAAAIKVDTSVCIWVHPALLEQAHPMSGIEGSFNAVSVLSSEVGHTLYYGRGAGGTATNSAIIADAVAIANGSAKNIFNNITIGYKGAYKGNCGKNTQETSAPTQNNMDMLNAESYIRLSVEDRTGVLADVTRIFQENNISIARVLQEDFIAQDNTEKPLESNKNVALIIITHDTQWRNIVLACEKLSLLKSVKEKPVAYPIIGPPDDTQ